MFESVQSRELVAAWIFIFLSELISLGLNLIDPEAVSEVLIALVAALQLVGIGFMIAALLVSKNLPYLWIGFGCNVLSAIIAISSIYLGHNTFKLVMEFICKIVFILVFVIICVQGNHTEKKK